MLFDALTALDPRQELGRLVFAARIEHGERLAECADGGMAVDLLRTLVPGRDVAVEVNADDGVVRGLDHGGQELAGGCSALVLGQGQVDGLAQFVLADRFENIAAGRGDFGVLEGCVVGGGGN